MIPMGALHPGLPSPVAIPRGYAKAVIDIKDCFFSIPLHQDDHKRFAFSIPITNQVGPNPRFQWKVLPQGMANSPTLCQKYVAQTINPFRLKYPEAYIIHYKDDILIATKALPESHVLALLMVQSLQTWGFHIAPPKKIQTQFPFCF